MSIRDELERLTKLHGGLLLPEIVVEAARQKSSPLHRSFTWDDGEAAHKWRLEQARHMLRVYVTMIDSGDRSRESRLYISLSTDRAQEGGYRVITEVLSNAVMRATLLEDAKTDMVRFRQKYAGLVELSNIFNAMKRHLQTRQPCPVMSR